MDINKNNGINVLSLFDGISCGQVALERAGIKVNKYFASEIEESAIKVTMKNYPNTIQLGDVTKIKGENLPKIDLIIGGSPCQGFSLAGKQLNFEDERSKLFFEYVRLIKEIKPTYFLLENVKMKKEYEKVITEYLGVEPIEINSALVSGQNRVRLYWTNIPNIEQPQDKGIKFYDVIDKEREWFPLLPWCLKVWGKKRKVDCLRTIENEKGFCLTTNRSHPKNYYLNATRDMMTKLTSDEAERLQTLPQGYTRGIPEGHRFKALGNGWTVDVIAHIFDNIQ